MPAGAVSAQVAPGAPVEGLELALSDVLSGVDDGASRGPGGEMSQLAGQLGLVLLALINPAAGKRSDNNFINLK